MRLLFIRHGEPDYVHDSLTEAGQREAELLARRIAPMPIKDYYVSPMGRARLTAAPTLAAAGRTAVECPWLREMSIPTRRPDVKDRLADVPWDWLPQDWLADERMLDRTAWREYDGFREAGVGQAVDRVAAELDGVLAGHGYERDGFLYRAVRPNHDTLAFFCHFGVTCAMLSHLMNVSPMILWHALCMAPGSVTEVNTEERRPGIAQFRVCAVGDTAHLYAHGVEPSFHARFCEVYGDGTRQD